MTDNLDRSVAIHLLRLLKRPEFSRSTPLDWIMSLSDAELQHLAGLMRELDPDAGREAQTAEPPAAAFTQSESVDAP